MKKEYRGYLQLGIAGLSLGLMIFGGRPVWAVLYLPSVFAGAGLGLYYVIRAAIEDSK